MQDHTEMLRACGEFAVGCVLIVFNGAWWAGLFHDLSIALSFISLLCGAVIGTHGVYRLLTSERRRERQ